MSDNTFLQIRTANRLLAAYYQRILPVVERLTSALDLRFYTWQPKEFWRPGNLTTNPFQRSAWDFLPGYSTIFLFYDAEHNNQLSKGQVLLEVQLVADTGIESLGGSNAGQADALNLPEPVEAARSVMRLSFYTPMVDQSQNWYEGLWHKAKPAPIQEVPMPQKALKFEALCCGFEVDIASLTTEEGFNSVCERAKQFKTILVKAAE